MAGPGRWPPSEPPVGTATAQSRVGAEWPGRATPLHDGKPARRDTHHCSRGPLTGNVEEKLLRFVGKNTEGRPVGEALPVERAKPDLNQGP